MQTIQTSLHKLLHKMEGKQSPVFLHTIIERYPVSRVFHFKIFQSVIFCRLYQVIERIGFCILQRGLD